MSTKSKAPKPESSEDKQNKDDTGKGVTKHVGDSEFRRLMEQREQMAERCQQPTRQPREQSEPRSKNEGDQAARIAREQTQEEEE